MLRPNFINIFLFFLIKYILFYIFLMFKNDDYTFIDFGSIRNGEDLFYYLWLFLFLPVISCVFFSVPLYFSFRVAKAIFFFLIVFLYLVTEYGLYTYLASQTNYLNGLYNAIIGIKI